VPGFQKFPLPWWERVRERGKKQLLLAKKPHRPVSARIRQFPLPWRERARERGVKGFHLSLGEK